MGIAAGAEGGRQGDLVALPRHGDQPRPGIGQERRQERRIAARRVGYRDPGAAQPEGHAFGPRDAHQGAHQVIAGG